MVTEVIPNPDPSNMTTEQLMRMLAAERDYTDGQIAILVQRLDDADTATKVLHETVTRVPTEMQLAVGHLKDVMNEKFDSVQTQFKERDTRAERESRDNKIAVDAAFAAQDKSATKQDEANQKAIDKSEKSTNEAITKNADAAEARADALSDKIDDLKERINRLDQAISGLAQGRREVSESRVEDRAASQNVRLAIGFAVTLILAAIIIVGVLVAAKNGSNP